ncbi:MAG TPA: glycoside hydrolase family 43 protein, partial [Polyangiaceae bacterium]|nr:glycoside hydrolase family 43 protein [Polyangiaceae bacterium]
MSAEHRRCVVVVLGAFAALLASAAPAGAATRYVFTTFRGDSASQEKLSVYTSSDGLNFKLLSDTGYGGPTSVLRDPSIMKHTDGLYYIAYTLQSWTTDSSSFGIATSTDLEKWTFLVEVPAGVAGAHATWAPEWFKDTDGVHLIVNIEGTQSGFRSYDFKAKDDTLKTWDAPAEMGIGPNNIDTFVVKSGATYHAFSKNETTKYIEHATASAFRGPWTWVGKDDWAGWGSGKEGIALYQLDDGSWRMFLDCYGNCGFLYSDSDDLDSWTATKTVPGGLSGTVRHGTVLREETAMGGMGSGGMASDAGATNGGRASAGAGGRGGGRGGASSDGGRGGLGSGGAQTQTGGRGGAAGGVGRGGNSGAAGAMSGAGTAGAGAAGAGAAGAGAMGS